MQFTVEVEDIACRFATVVFGILAKNTSPGPIVTPSTKSEAAVPPSKQIKILFAPSKFLINKNLILSPVATEV